MTSTRSNAQGGTVVVIGGGIAGISAAVEASEAGRDVVLVERNPYIGGRVVQMYRYFPKLCPPGCGMEIHLKRLRTTDRVRVLTNTRVISVNGAPGKFTVELVTAPRGVTASCTGCGECVDVCPETRPDTFNYGLSTTKAIYLPHATAYPPRYAVDFAHCKGSSCGKCKEVCAYGAVELEGKEERETLEATALIVTTGWKPYQADKLDGLNYASLDSVVTNVEFERLAAADGPTQGKIVCPGSDREPSTVAFVQCAGSRDELHLAHCSAVCCAATMKQVKYVLEKLPNARVHVFYIDRRTPGRLEDLLQQLEDEERVTFTKGKVASIELDGGTGALQLVAEDTLTGQRETLKADLAVLAVGLVPESGDAGLPESWSVDEHGFMAAGEIAPGVFSAGCARWPSDVSTGAKGATAAVMNAMQVMIRE